MPLSWNDIRDRAMKFSHDWAGESSESAESQSFWNDFFAIYGIQRRRVAAFEQKAKKIDGRDGYIDLLWKGILLIEHKSRNQDLNRAYSQATDYFPGIKERDLPRYILVSDFERFRLYDLDENTQQEFVLKDLHKNIKLFGFIAGYQTKKLKEEDPVNIKAAEKMGKLHDRLKDIGYEGHSLELYLVRLLFCMFAEDSAVFDRRQFQDFIEQRTSEDGSDLAARLQELFEVLNIEEKKRLKNLDEQLNAFKYVNGKLFEERLPIASFNREMRESLLECCSLDWSRISPAIFGAMFQSIMDKKLRRNLGAHYTSEKNILKLIGPLFLDDLHAEFESIKNQTKKLEEFHKKIAGLKFLDPACGCGNFLIIAYRELRLLELEILKILLRKKHTGFLDVSSEILCNVDQFYGIEIEEFPAQIAQTAMWLTDHQMNMRVSEEFGQYFSRLPLQKSATIVYGPKNGNALRINWEDLVKPSELNYILGNPPFVGAMVMETPQRTDIADVFKGIKGAGVLDYVAAWYIKATHIMEQNKAIKTAYVSTNSISQGEQVGILWGEILKKPIKINFAHRTFQWSNEASGVAAVHCVIIGFSFTDSAPKRLFDYETLKSDPSESAAQNISPYLVNASNILITNRRMPLADVPEMKFGSMPRDGGNLIFSDEEKNEFLRQEPNAKKWIRPYMGAEEFINNKKRWCLWLKDVPPSEIKNSPKVIEKIEGVRKFRLASKAASTRKFAQTPSIFCQIAQPDTDYLLVPSVSSERRNYIPIGFMQKNVIANNLVFVLPKGKLYHFGVLSSAIHMAWVRYTCGRLESRYRYSKDIVYNNFPWPTPSDTQKSAIEKAAQDVLDARAAHPNASLADLYDPLTMPPSLVKAHRALDAAVDAAYSKKKFSGDSDRVAFLFDLYQKITAPLDVSSPQKTPKKRKKA